MKYDYNSKTCRLKPTQEVLSRISELRYYLEEGFSQACLNDIQCLLEGSLQIIESAFDPVIIADNKLQELLSPVMFATEGDEISSIQLEDPSTDGPEAA